MLDIPMLKLGLVEDLRIIHSWSQWSTNKRLTDQMAQNGVPKLIMSMITWSRTRCLRRSKERICLLAPRLLIVSEAIQLLIRDILSHHYLLEKKSFQCHWYLNHRPSSILTSAWELLHSRPPRHPYHQNPRFMGPEDSQIAVSLLFHSSHIHSTCERAR